MTPPSLADAVAEAVAAFDAANHAFGRFVTYVVRPRNQPVPPAIQHVREALQDAAVLAPEATTTETAREFLDAVQEAQRRLAGFLAAPPPGYTIIEEVADAPDALAEAITLLSAALNET